MRDVALARQLAVKRGEEITHLAGVRQDLSIQLHASSRSVPDPRAHGPGTSEQPSVADLVLDLDGLCGAPINRTRSLAATTTASQCVKAVVINAIASASSAFGAAQEKKILA